MADFTPGQLDNLSTLAAQMNDQAEAVGRELIVGYADEDGGLPVAWIIAKPDDVPVIVFEPPSWLSLLFKDDDTEDDGPQPVPTY